MSKNIAGYISNLGKSVAYAATDKFKELTPASTDFAETNSELFKDIYSSVKNYKTTYTRSMKIFKSSKVYEAGDLLKTSLIEDIQSGKFYNKQRIDKINTKIASSGMGDFGDLDFDDNIDDNFDDTLDFNDFDDEFSNSDLAMISAIDNSNSSASKAVSMAIAKTGEYVVESQRINNNILYSQNIKAFNMFNSGISDINSNLNTLIRFSNEALSTHIQNTNAYFDETTKLMQDQTALLRKIAENTSKSEDENKETKTSSKLTFDDIAGIGTPDLKLYMKNIMNNVSNLSGPLSSISNIAGEDSNALLALVASPLQEIPKALINKVIPKTIDKSMKALDESVENFFGSLMLKFHDMSNDDDMIKSTIGKIFGINNYVKGVDVSKYEKGKVDWDGKSRKALIEVIPTQLSKIVSLLSGDSEKIYDYDKAKFVSAKTLEDIKNKGNKNYVDNATSDMKDVMDQYMNRMTFNSLDDKQSLLEDIEKIFNKMYNSGKLFKANSKIEDEYFEYGVSEKNYAAFKAMFKNAPKHIQHKINNEIMSTRNKENQDYRDIEQNGDNILNYLYNGFNPSEYANEKDGKLNTNKSVLKSNALNEILDNKGKNIFYYLQNMYRELIFIRENGISGSNRRNLSTPEILDSSGNIIRNARPVSIDDITIPDSSKKTENMIRREEEERKRERFINSESNRRKKNKDLSYINFSEIEDSKELEDTISSDIKIYNDINNRKENKLNNPTLIDKLLQAKTLSEKGNTVLQTMDDITGRSVSFFNSVIKKVDQRMYELVYGTEGEKRNVKGFLDAMIYEMKSTFSRFNNFLDEKILIPLKDKLGIDNMKDMWSNVLDKIGINKDTVKDYLFGDEGLLKNVVDSTKNTFKNAYNTAKDSVKDSFSPITNKFKEFTNKHRKFKDLSEMDEEFDVTGGNNNTYKEYGIVSGIGKYANNAEMINQRLGINNFNNKNQSYYESMFGNMDNDRGFRNRTIYTYDKDVNTEEEELRKMKKNIINARDVLSRSTSNYDPSYYNNLLSDYNNRKNEFDVHSKYLKMNVKEDTLNMLKVLGLDENDEFTKSILESFVISKGKDSISGLTDIKGNDLLEFIKNKSDIFKTDSRYSKLKTNFESTFGLNDLDFGLNTILNRYNDLHTGENINQEDNNSEKYDPSRLDAFLEIEEESNTQVSSIVNFVSEISDNLKALKDLFSSLIPTNNNRNVGPTVLNSQMLGATEEGNARNLFSQNLANVIANWMHGNTPEYAEGGYVEEAKVATIGKGEVVLTKESVKDLTSVVQRVLDSLEGGNIKSETIAENAFGSLSKLNKKAGGLENLDILKHIQGDNEEVFNKYESLSDVNKIKYKRIMKSVNSELKAEKEKIENPLKQRENDSEITKAGKEMLGEAKRAVNVLFGDPAKDNKKLNSAISDAFTNIKEYAPDMTSNALLGSGISLVTGAIGGPLLGAAVGASIGLVKNSDKMKNWLFGDMVDGERQGGAIKKDTMEKITKYLPDMKKYGITGGVSSLLIPGIGPIAGVMLGSGIGFAKNNEEFKKSLFGEEEGLIKPETRKKIEKAMPRMTIGAGLGLFAGPFGLVGNTILGSALGFASSTDKFEKTLFGEKNEKTGEYENGILPSLRKQIVDPIKGKFKDVKTNVFDYIKENMLKPLKSSLDPIKKEISLIIKNTFKSVGNTLDKIFETTFGVPLSKYVNEILSKTRKIFGGLFKFGAKVGGGLLSLPFKGVGAYGDHLRKKHIKDGNADYMSADERLGFRDNHNMLGIFRQDKFKNADETISSLSEEDMVSMKENMSNIINYDKNIKKDRSKLLKETGSEVSKKLSAKQSTKLMKNLDKGKYDKARSIIKNNINKGKISSEDGEKLNLYLEDKIKSHASIDSKMNNKDSEKNELYSKLREQGLNVNDKNIDKYLDLITKELKSKGTKNNEESINKVINTPEMEQQTEQHEEVVGLFNNAISILAEIRSQNYEQANPEMITEFDENGNEIQYKRKGDEYIPNTSDSSTNEALKEANREDEEKTSLVERLKEITDGSKKEDKDTEEGDKKEGFLQKIFKFLSGGTLIKMIGVGLGGILVSSLVKSFKDKGVVKSIVEILFGKNEDGEKSGGVKGFIGDLTDMSGEGGEESLDSHFLKPIGRNIVTGGATGFKGFAKNAAKNSDGPIKKLIKGITSPIRTTAKFGTKSMSKMANRVDDIYAKTSINKFGKTLGSKLNSKIDDKVIGTGIKAIDNIQNTGVINSALQSIESFFKKILNSKYVIKILGETADGIPRSLKLIDEFVPKIISTIAEGASKAGGKTAAKLAGAVSTGGLLNAAFAITDFISGFNDAKNILGITAEPTLGMKACAGFIKALNGLFIITAFIPERTYINLFFDHVLPIFGEGKGQINEIKKLRESGKKELDAYNSKHRGNKLSLTQYNTMKKKESSFNNKSKDMFNKHNASAGKKLGKHGDGLSEIMSNIGQTIGNFFKNPFGSSTKYVTKGPLAGKGDDNSSFKSAGESGDIETSKNNFPYYKQGDPKWNQTSYGGYKISKGGCGPTSVAMILTKLLGKQVTPNNTAEEAYKAGHWRKGQGASWSMFKHLGDKFGVPVSQMDPSTFKTAADKGMPIALSGKSGGRKDSPFTSGGHIVAYVGKDSNGNYLINDPRGPQYSHAYTADQLQGMRQAWAFGSEGSLGSNMNVTAASGDGSEAVQQENTGPSIENFFGDLTSAGSKFANKLLGFDNTEPAVTETPTEEQSIETEQNKPAPKDRTKINAIVKNPKDIRIGTAYMKGGGIPGVDAPETYTDPVDGKIYNINDMAEYAKRAKLNIPLGPSGDGQIQVRTVKGIPLGSKQLASSISSQYNQYFQSAAKEFGVDSELLKAIAMQESGGNASSKGAAWGLMQIENGGTTTDFIKFGKNRPDGPYSKEDRLNPAKAIPFAAKRVSEDYRRYKGDYLKTTQAYNWSHYSLDKLLKVYPNGDEWIAHRNEVGKYNGTGRSKYGDPKYIENVFRYYHGNQIPSDGVGTVTGDGSSTAATAEENSGPSVENFFGDLTSAMTTAANKFFGFETQTASATTDELGAESAEAELASGDKHKTASGWFTSKIPSKETSGYGNRIHPVTKKPKFHTGVDYGAKSGLKIPSPVAGKVVMNQNSNGYGNLVVVEDKNKYGHYFAHMNKRSPLKVGSTVKVGDIVGNVGSTGMSTGPHLHYEVRNPGLKNSTDPNAYLSKLYNGGLVKAPLTKTQKNSVVRKPAKKDPIKQTQKITSTPLSKLIKNNAGKGGVDIDTNKVISPKIDIPSVRSINNNNVQNTNSNNKLLEIIIQILYKIVNNTNNLSEIVKLLSKSLNIEVPKSTIEKIEKNKSNIKENKKALIDVIKQSTNMIDPSNEMIMATLEQLAKE